MASRSISCSYAVAYRACRRGFDALPLRDSRHKVHDLATVSGIIEMALSSRVIFNMIKNRHYICEINSWMQKKVKLGSYRAVCRQIIGVADRREVYK